MTDVDQAIDRPYLHAVALALEALADPKSKHHCCGCALGLERDAGYHRRSGSYSIPSFCSRYQVRSRETEIAQAVLDLNAENVRLRSDALRGRQLAASLVRFTDWLDEKADAYDVDRGANEGASSESIALTKAAEALVTIVGDGFKIAPDAHPGAL